MANPNPYKNEQVDPWIEQAFKDGNFQEIRKKLQYLLHCYHKFENCYQREGARVRKLRKILDAHGIAYELEYYKERNPYKDPLIQKEGTKNMEMKPLQIKAVRQAAYYLKLETADNLMTMCDQEVMQLVENSGHVVVYVGDKVAILPKKYRDVLIMINN